MTVARRLHLVFVSWEYPPAFGGGIGTYVASMTRILARLGHRVSVVTVTDRSCASREMFSPPGCEANPIRIIRLPIPWATGVDPSQTLSIWHARSRQVHECLVGMMRAEPIDFIEFADYRGEGLVFLTSLPRAERPACAVKLHTPCIVLNRYNPGRPSAAVLGSFENEAILAADMVTSPSRALAREMQELVPALGERRVHIQPYPLDLSFMQAAREDVAELDEIVYVGRLEERKGVASLVAAAATFLPACPGATLRLVGGDTALSAERPSMRAELDRMISGMGSEVRERIVFEQPMPRERLVRMYQQARVCVFPSLFENFPNVCLEAMALGRCVVGSSNSGMAEMIEHGRSGLIFPSGDAGLLADAVIRVFHLPVAARQAMGSAARARATALYEPERVAKEFVGFVEESQEELVRGGAGGGRGAASERRAVWDGGASVGVVIPCYNHGAYVRDAVVSVLSQTRAVDEIVIVDDGSPDPATPAALQAVEREFAGALDGRGVRVIRQANAGLAEARNAGVAALSTRYFVPLDSDDLLAREFVERLVPVLEGNPGLGYAYSWVQYFGSHDGQWHCPAYEPAKLLVENLSVATALIRREAFLSVGGYNRAMVYGFEDWDFWLALLGQGWHGALVPEVLFKYRKHAGGSMLSRTQERRAEMIARMVEHHRGMYEQLLAYGVAEKDRLFFRDHMELWRLRESMARASHLHAPPPADEPVGGAASEPAESELALIEGSRAYRMVRLLKRTPIYEMVAAARWGADWQLLELKESPQQRLHRIKQSRTYRLIQSLKRTPLYRVWARKRYEV